MRGRTVVDENWARNAACRDKDPVLFFGSGKESLSQREAREWKAKAICTACRSKPACLDYALATRQEDGVWGGLSEDERRRQMRHQVPVPVPVPAPRKPVTAKECPSCRQTKPAAAYGRDRSRADGLHSSCKECTNQAQARRRVAS